MALPNSISIPPKDTRRIIAAISAVTLIEWYDFYLFGSLATVIAPHFFPRSNPDRAFLYTLAIFAAGFIVRPLGPLVFGRPGQRRENAIPLTLILMGASTFVIGLLPGYESIGLAAPLIVLLLRLLQGLALGGEYGGIAARIHPTGSLGLFLGLAAILIARYALDPDRTASVAKFDSWGWRLPFLFSIVLLAISVYIRRKSKGSLPEKQDAAPHTSPKPAPLTRFAAAMGQGVVFYTSLFYIQAFLEKTCQIDFGQSKSTLLIAIALATPFFLLFGRWSDRIGRKGIMLAGMLLAILTWSFLFSRLRTISATEGRTELAGQKEIRSTVVFIGKTRDLVRTSSTFSHFADETQVVETTQDTVYAGGRTSQPTIAISKTLNTNDYWKVVAVLFLMALYATMVCTSPSLPDHPGNSLFGGPAPFLSFLLTTIFTGHSLAGLWYPIAITAFSFLIVAWFLPGDRRTAHRDETQES